MRPKKSDACGAREQLKRRYCLIVAANSRNTTETKHQEKRRTSASMSTGKKDLYKWLEDHEFPHFLLSYTEDQAGQYI